MENKTMKLKDFASDLVAKNHFIKASFGGFAGAGKSRTATEFIIGAYKDFDCKKPILIIDNEKGSRFLKPIFNNAGIDTLVKDTIHLADVLLAFKYLENGDIDFLFIDSLTKIWYRYIKDYKEKNGKGGKPLSFMSLNHWGKVIPEWQDKFNNAFVNLDGNCVFTGRGGYEYSMEVNEETGKKEFVRSGIKMKIQGETSFEPDMNIWMELKQKIDSDDLKQWNEAQILKDRSGLIHGKTFKNPTYSDFKPVVDFLKSVEKGDVKGSTKTENLAPSENRSTFVQDRDILVEEIKGLYDSLGLGSSVDAKKLKSDINNMLFETRSWTKLEKDTKMETLRGGLTKLREFHVMCKDRKPDSYDDAMTVLNEALDNLQIMNEKHT